MDFGMSVDWVVGSREGVGNTVVKGKGESARQVFEPRLGKNGGPVIKQDVVKVFVPKAS